MGGGGGSILSSSTCDCYHSDDHICDMKSIKCKDFNNNYHMVQGTKKILTLHVYIHEFISFTYKASTCITIQYNLLVNFLKQYWYQYMLAAELLLYGEIRVDGPQRYISTHKIKLYIYCAQRFAHGIGLIGLIKEYI